MVLSCDYLLQFNVVRRRAFTRPPFWSVSLLRGAPLITFGGTLCGVDQPAGFPAPTLPWMSFRHCWVTWCPCSELLGVGWSVGSGASYRTPPANSSALAGVTDTPVCTATVEWGLHRRFHVPCSRTWPRSRTWPCRRTRPRSCTRPSHERPAAAHPGPCNIQRSDSGGPIDRSHHYQHSLDPIDCPPPRARGASP